METNKYADPFKLWQHPEMRDVAFEIDRCVPISGTSKCRIRVSWWNVVKSHPPYYMNIHQSFTVTDEWLCKLKEFTV